MNCKPGDLAVVKTTNPWYSERIVEVLYAPPSHRFKLPDGCVCTIGSGEPRWVLRFIGTPILAPLIGGGTRRTFYGVGADRALRPLRGDPDECELVTADSIGGDDHG